MVSSIAIMILCWDSTIIKCTARHLIWFYGFVRHHYQIWYYVLGSVLLPSMLLGAKCDTNFWGTASSVTVCSGTVLNVRISWHETSITKSRSPITDCDIDTSAKCNTVMHENVYGTNDYWPYPGNGAKCDSVVITILLLWSYLGNSAKCVSRLFVYHSFRCPRFVWMILRERITQFIRIFFRRSGWFFGTKLPGSWRHLDKKNSPRTINNHLLERIGVKVICPIFLLKIVALLSSIYCSVFKLHTVAR